MSVRLFGFIGIAIVVSIVIFYFLYTNQFRSMLGVGNPNTGSSANLTISNDSNLENFPIIKPDQQQTTQPKEVPQPKHPSTDIDPVKAALLMHNEVNKQRLNAGLKQLQWDETIYQVALAHSKDMATRNYFSHINPEGDSPFVRGDKAGHVCIAAENLGKGGSNYGQNTDEQLAKETVNGLLNSPDHKRIMLTKEYTKEGIGIYFNQEGNIAYITQDFC